MGKVDRNCKDMPMPSYAYPDRNDGRAFILLPGEDGKPHKRTIGHLTDSTQGQERMVPNQYFKETFTKPWSEMYPNEKVPFHEMAIGLYSLTWGICDCNGLYSLLQDVYGPLHANSVLDYCMFTIKHRSNTTLVYPKVMEREVLFSDKVYSDSWYSDFFSKKKTEDQNHQFRINWVKALVSQGLKKVWLCIDGSNNDCDIRSTFLAQYGFPKSHNKNKRIVGYMYVVDAETGMPVTYSVYEGNVPDSQAFQTIATFLGGFQIEIEGVILDRGFAVEPVFKAIEERGWGYVIMLQEDKGYTDMVREHGEEIRWKSEHLIDDEAIFGICDTKKLFGNHDRVSNICLFFDGASGSIHSNKLIRQIQAAKKKAERAIANGARASIKKQFQKYLKIVGEGPDRKVVADYEKWDADMQGKGFYSMATSAGITPSQANRLYKMRDVSETQYSILKTQEGGHTSRVHYTEGIYSKFATAFISSIVRHEIQSTCEYLGLETNEMIQWLDRIVLLYTAQGKYEAVRNISTDLESLLGHFGVYEDDVVRLGKEFNNRNKTDSKNPVRVISRDVPVILRNTRKVGRPPVHQDSKETPPVSTATPEITKSKGGRPKGRKDSQPRKPRSDKGKKRGPRTIIVQP